MCLLVPYFSVVLFSIPVVQCLPQGVFKRKGAIGYIVLLDLETSMKIIVDTIMYKLLLVLLAIF